MRDAWSDRYDDGETAVYRLYDASDQLLYVGVTPRPKSRWKKHEDGKTWWHLVARKEVEWHPGREEALLAEAEAIASEGPRFNSTKKGFRKDSANEYDDTADFQTVEDGLRQLLKQDHPALHTALRTGETAAMFGVARATASTVMWRLAQEGLLVRAGHGRYVLPASE